MLFQTLSEVYSTMNKKTKAMQVAINKKATPKGMALNAMSSG
jgi:hypothetical protein